jgi:hypothetical protein
MHDERQEASRRPVVEPPLEERPVDGSKEIEPGEDSGDSAQRNHRDDSDDDINSSISVGIQSGSISGETIKTAGVLIEQLNVLWDRTSSVTVKLSAQHFRSWAPEDLERYEKELISESSSVEKLIQILEEKRFLILIGDPEVGKGSTALLAASILIRRKKLKGALSCQSLDTTVRVDLDEISGAASFRQQVVLLEDALAGENPDLIRFLRNLEIVRYETLTARLKKNGSVIVITVASHTIEAWKTRLDNLGILHPIDLPSAELQCLALRRFAERLPVVGPPREALMAFLNANEKDLAHDLGAVPKIARFVQEYLRDVAEGQLMLRQALDRMDDLSEWLMNDLAGDLDAQAAVLSLVLGSAASLTVGVPWFAFDRMRRMILDLLRRELRIPDDQPLPPQELGRGPVFLDRARARVVEMPAPLSDLVRFKDDRYSRRLWQALLGRGRSFATMLLPLLQDLTSDADPFLQASAARALGRIGQIEPIHHAAPCLRAWTLGAEPNADLAAAFL